MPQPPPRKVKPVVWMKEIHTKQLSLLQTREQQLLDIIEDIRSFSKQRSDIERLHGQSLLKLCGQLLSKKDIFSAVANDKSEEFRLIHTAWKTLLQETEKVAQQRLNAADIYSAQVSEKCKSLKANKSATVKKVMEQLQALQADCSQSVKEMGMFHKQYIDDETAAHEARVKSSEAENKLTNKDTGLFSSVGTLKKNSAKTFTKMNTCNARAASSRNGYLLELSAVNAHNERMHTTDMPALFKTLDEGIFEQLAEFLSMMSQTEVDVCNEIIPSQQKSVDTSKLVNEEYNRHCFIRAHEVFAEKTTFTFDAVYDDPIVNLTSDFNEQSYLDKETRNWARKVAKETRHLVDLHDRLNKLEHISADSKSLGTNEHNRSSVTPTDGNDELNQLQTHVRRAEIAKLKAEARLGLLREAGLPVDEILTQATTEHEAADTQSMTSRLSSHPSVDGMSFDSASDQGDFQSTDDGKPALYNVTAIYFYQANHQDEMTIQEGETISILDEGHGDGWYRGRNYKGEVGLVPENYIERIQEEQPFVEESTYSYKTENEPQVQQDTHNTDAHTVWCRALYDYHADGDDEISFSAGQLIALLSKDENGIDDGYWKGDVNGVSGMFPSIVVEELDQQYDWTPQAVTQTILAVTQNAQEETDPDLYDYNQQYNAQQYDTTQHVGTLPVIDEQEKTEDDQTGSTVEDLDPLDREYTQNDLNKTIENEPQAPTPRRRVQHPLESPPTVSRQSKPNLPPKPSVDLSTKPSLKPAGRPKALAEQKQENPPDVNDNKPVHQARNSAGQQGVIPPWERASVARASKPPPMESPVFIESPTPPHQENLVEQPHIPQRLDHVEHPPQSVSSTQSRRPPPEPPKQNEYRPQQDYQPHYRDQPDLYQSGYQQRPEHNFYSQRPKNGGQEHGGDIPRGRRGQMQAKQEPHRKSVAEEYFQEHLDAQARDQQRCEEYPPADTGIRGRYSEITTDVRGRSYSKEELDPARHGRQRNDDGRDRSASDRSFHSHSSTDSQEGGAAIRVVGRGHRLPSTDGYTNSPGRPMSLKEVERTLPPQGIYNPSYRVAMDTITPRPGPRQHKNLGMQSTSPLARSSRSPQNPRTGGLPGHVKHGISQVASTDDADDAESEPPLGPPPGPPPPLSIPPPLSSTPEPAPRMAKYSDTGEDDPRTEN